MRGLCGQLAQQGSFMTDIDYLINRFHELFRRQEAQRQLKQLTLKKQIDQNKDPPADGKKQQ